MVIFAALNCMTPFLTEFIFVGIIASMILLLAALQFIAKYISRRRMRALSLTSPQNSTKSEAKIIALPQNAKRQANERFLVKDSVGEEEIV